MSVYAHRATIKGETGAEDDAIDVSVNVFAIGGHPDPPVRLWITEGDQEATIWLHRDKALDLLIALGAALAETSERPWAHHPGPSGLPGTRL